MDELIEAYAAHLRRRRASPHTIKKRIPFLARADRELPCGLVSASSDEIEAWLFRDEYSDWSLATYFYHLAGFFEWATDPRVGELDFDPMKIIDRPTAEQGLPRPINTGQLQQLLAELAGDMLLAAKLAAYAGMRCIEICRADRQHVDADNIRIPVGKGGRAGIVPTHPIIWEAVQGLPPGPLLRHANGNRWTEKQLSDSGARHLTRILGEVAGLHRLRHWFGTETYRATRDLRRTQELMRHKSPNSTVIYTLIADEERGQAIAALPR